MPYLFIYLFIYFKWLDPVEKSINMETAYELFEASLPIHTKIWELIPTLSDSYTGINY